jgi:hypothetical protein
MGNSVYGSGADACLVGESSGLPRERGALPYPNRGNSEHHPTQTVGTRNHPTQAAGARSAPLPKTRVALTLRSACADCAGAIRARRRLRPPGEDTVRYRVAAARPFRIVDRRGFIVKVIHILQSINWITLIMMAINLGVRPSDSRGAAAFQRQGNHQDTKERRGESRMAGSARALTALRRWDTHWEIQSTTEAQRHRGTETQRHRVRHSGRTEDINFRIFARWDRA